MTRLLRFFLFSNCQTRPGRRPLPPTPAATLFVMKLHPLEMTSHALFKFKPRLSIDLARRRPSREVMAIAGGRLLSALLLLKHELNQAEVCVWWWWDEGEGEEGKKIRLIDLWGCHVDLT